MQPVRPTDPDSLPFRISLEAANRTVGLIAFGLPFVLLGVTAAGIGCPSIDSLSDYYFTPLGGDLFSGALMIIGSVMLFFYSLPKQPDGDLVEVSHYRGHTKTDFRLARLAGVMAFVVALVPASGPGCEDLSGSVARTFITEAQGGPGTPITGTVSMDFLSAIGQGDTWLDWLHYGAAAVMFLILAFYSYVVFTRVQTIDGAEPQVIETGSRKWMRNRLYRACGIVILAAIVALALSLVVADPGALNWWDRANLTFWFESIALFAFGLSWSVKGRVLPILRDRDEDNPRKTLKTAQARLG